MTLGLAASAFATLGTTMPARRLDRSLTAQQVADQLGGLLSANTLVRLARQGKIPGAFRLGGRTFFAYNTAMYLIRDLSDTSPAGYAITIEKEGTNGHQT
jgi:hypothetical protein